jgi:adenylate cyclase
MDSHQAKRIDATYRNALLLALVFGIANIPLTLSPFLNSWPTITSAAFACVNLFLLILRKLNPGYRAKAVRILFFSNALGFLILLTLFAAPGVNVHFYLLPLIAGGIFLLSDAWIIASCFTAGTLVIFIMMQLIQHGGLAIIATIPPETALAAARMNLTGAGLMFVLVMILMTREYARSEKNLDAERKKNASLLQSLYPEKILERMLKGETYIAERRDGVAILFCDLVGFTAMSRTKPPAELVDLLNSLYSDFDEIAAVHGVEKIKTIGDSYMAVAGIFGSEADPAASMADFAIAALRVVTQSYPALGVRIGIHSGTVMAGILGRKKQSFDVWGDAVNYASRLEGAAETNQILCSADFAALLPEDQTRKAARVDLKGIGSVDCFEIIPPKA